MSLALEQRALRRAYKHGTPFVLRAGADVVLVKSVKTVGQDRVEGDYQLQQFTSAGHAQAFVHRAVHERGWKCDGDTGAPRMSARTERAWQLDQAMHALATEVDAAQSLCVFFWRCETAASQRLKARHATSAEQRYDCDACGWPWPSECVCADGGRSVPVR